VLSPAVLPSLNLMLDVPALTLTLAALAVFLSSEDRYPWFGAATAGVLAGLAMQTKYTGLLAIPQFVLAAATGGKRRDWQRLVIAIGIAGLVVIGWEMMVWIHYGRSHFLYHVGPDAAARMSRSGLIAPFVGLIGSVGAPVAMLGLAAQGVSLRRLFTVAGVIVIGFTIVAIVPRPLDSSPTPTAVVFGLLGVGVLAVVAASVLRLRRSPIDARDDRFVIGWLGLEIAGYFVLTPWPAVRRVIGCLVVLTLLVARGAVIRSRAAMLFAAACGVCLALAFEMIDIENGGIERDAVAAIDAQIRDANYGGTVWFLGHRGWQFYAERAGWRPVDPGFTVVRSGDWLVVPDAEFGGARVTIPPSADPVGEIQFWSRLPLGTIPYYYGTNAAVRKREGPFMTVALYQMTAAGALQPR